MRHDRRPIVLPIACLMTLAFLGCERPQPKLAPPRPPVVTVSLPILDDVSDFEEFTGRSDAVKTVEIRARVTGYVQDVLFHDGDEVEAGTLLFKIDDRPYKADLARAKASLTQNEAHRKRLLADYQRAETLYGRGSIAREEYDKVAGDRAEAEAMVGVATASLESADLNVGFTEVRAPLPMVKEPIVKTTPTAGPFMWRLSRRMVDPGNLVKQDETMLTTVVSLDPIYVYFDVDERTLLQLRRLVREGKMKSRYESEITIEAGLADEDDFPHRGQVDFSDNRLDPNTGTLRLRALLPNPASPKNPKLRVLSPGLFMRVRLPIGDKRRALTVPEQALGTDQGRKYLYVVDSHDEVVFRPVKVGRLDNGQRVIEEGLSANERIILTGLQRVRPGAKVIPKSATPAGGPAGKAAGPSQAGPPETPAPPPGRPTQAARG
jgi:multidrug efflux pump subunit AcrA (membrane-fusion protein)